MLKKNIFTEKKGTYLQVSQDLRTIVFRNLISNLNHQVRVSALRSYFNARNMGNIGANHVNETQKSKEAQEADCGIRSLKPSPSCCQSHFGENTTLYLSLIRQCWKKGCRTSHLDQQAFVALNPQFGLTTDSIQLTPEKEIRFEVFKIVDTKKLVGKYVIHVPTV